MEIDNTIDSQRGQPRYLVLKGAGGAGLGDRLRALGAAILYARLTNRTIVVDWCDTAYGEGSTNLFTQLFSLQNVSHAYDIPDCNTVWPPAWQDRLHISFNNIRAQDGAALDGSDWNRQEALEKYSFDLGDLDNPAQAIVMWDFDQFHKLLLHAGKLYSEAFPDADSLMSRILRDHLVPRSVKTCEPLFDATKTIGIHVRHTDEAARVRATPSLRQYVQTVRRTICSTGAKKIFLATDNSTVVDLFRRQFGAAQVITLPKWFPSPGNPIHKNPECPAPLQSARDGVADLYMLAACHHLVVLHNSSFSIMARLLSQAPRDQITVMFVKANLCARIAGRLHRLCHALRKH